MREPSGRTEKNPEQFGRPGEKQFHRNSFNDYKYRNLRDNLGFTRPCGKLLKQMLQAAYETAAKTADASGKPVNWDFDRFILIDQKFKAMNGGRFVEESSILIEQSTEQLQKAKSELENTVNEIKAIRDVLDPELNRLIDDLRAKRQTVNRETGELLAGLKDIRKFFIDREYGDEKQKLLEFILLMERLQALQKSGFLEAMTDAILKLAEGGENVRK